VSPHQTNPAVPPLPQDDAATARLVLRYRPSADVLLGVVQYPPPTGAVADDFHDVIETPNADVRVTWRSTGSGTPNHPLLLSSFEIIHAHSGWDAGAQTLLPVAVREIAHRFIEGHHAASTAASNPLEQLRARVESTTPVTVSTLSRNAGHHHVRAGTQQDALQVARALDHLADALAAAQGTPGSLESERTVEFSELLRELGAALADHDALPAPGTSAATRQALRGGLPLTNQERRALLVALTDIDHADRWVLVANALEQLATSLTPSPNHGAGTSID
jgi:hypothetical protein